MRVSYAQNFEDVILWRALRHVERGFYIDIGAQDPVIDSVSLAFYENGWRGVHVEPNAAFAEKLRRARTDETVIQAAIGTKAESIAFWEFPDTGLSTGDPAIAARHIHGNREAVRVEVPCMRLSSLLSDYRNKVIHWLKIDVEGMERAVIQSWRPAKARPWIVVIESIKPLSTEPSFADWAPLLIKLGYEFVYFDGLNHFYISCEQAELKKHFGPGPNIFDDFALSGHANAPFCRLINNDTAKVRGELAARANEAAHLSKRADELRIQVATQIQTFAKATALWEEQFVERGTEIENLSARVKSLAADVLAKDKTIVTRDAELAQTRQALAAQEAELARTRQELAAREADFARIFASTSWRITAPLRVASRLARWFIARAWSWITLQPTSRPRRIARWVARRFGDFRSNPPRREATSGAHNAPDLSPQARRIYFDLKAAIERSGSGKCA